MQRLFQGEQLNRSREILERFQMPRYTTTERDAIYEPQTGQTIFNTTLGFVQTYNGTSWSSPLEEVYPIGSVYTNYSNSTNPGTLLGIGTWTAIEGEVVVGYKAGDADFGTAGSATGDKVITLTSAQSGLPSHLHTVNPPATTTTADSHTHAVRINTTNSAASSNANADPVRGTSAGSWSGAALDTQSDNHDHSVDIAQFNSGSVTAANAASSHNNIQPSRICYVWRRTA